MAELFERLHEAERLEAEELRPEGEQAGREWAKDTATPRQLRRLEETIATYANQRGPGNGVAFYVEVMSDGRNGRIADSLCRDIDGGEPPANEVTDFWANALGDEGEDRVQAPAFAEGFIAGALEFWTEYKVVSKRA